eukprot:TRINITY_DN22966_c0_g1_i1.p1 TRINITY_DN22966_c0_g1~~TRINITY_DN22966_c0_g1_i1.p1  ORF type:complete len:316 (+),score=29.50 TRINITY_DN22966_c0_g1_i1:163-1110(+)
MATYFCPGTTAAYARLEEYGHEISCSTGGMSRHSVRDSSFLKSRCYPVIVNHVSTRKFAIKSLNQALVCPAVGFNELSLPLHAGNSIERLAKRRGCRSMCKDEQRKTEFQPEARAAWQSQRRTIALGAGLLLSLVDPMLVRAGETEGEEVRPRQLITNLDDAREAGERRRDEKERSNGTIVTLPSGIKYRALRDGSGRALVDGDVAAISYVVYRLNGLYLDSVGYGNEGKDDVGDTINITVGVSNIPRAVTLGMSGMRVGEKRRILVPLRLGWVSPETQPGPTSFAASRRFFNARDSALLFEVELVKIRNIATES